MYAVGQNIIAIETGCPIRARRAQYIPTVVVHTVHTYLYRHVAIQVCMYVAAIMFHLLMLSIDD